MKIIQGAMEYEDIEYCIADRGEKERERERESERYLSIYSMGDYPNVGCHLTSPTVSHLLVMRIRHDGQIG
jgi:hypothetical protein